LRLDRDGNDRLRKVHSLENDRKSLAPDRVSGLSKLETHDNGDITRFDPVDLFRPVGVHAKNPVDPFPFALIVIEDGDTRFERSLIHSDKGVTPGILVSLDLEDHPHCLAGVTAVNFNLGTRFRVLSPYWWQLLGSGKEVNHRVEKGLNPDVPKARPHVNGKRRPRESLLPQHGTNQICRNFRVFKHELSNLVGVGGHLVKQSFPPLLREVAQGIPYRNHLEGATVVIFVPPPLLHCEEIDHALEIALPADRD
jgi:hypothetical protein